MGRAHVERKQLGFPSASTSTETPVMRDARILEPAVTFHWNHLGDMTWNSVTSVQWSYYCFLSYIYLPLPPHVDIVGLFLASHSVPVDPVIIVGRAEPKEEV